MVINRKIIRTMLENKSQYLGSLLLIITSCLLYTMFNQVAGSLKNIEESFIKNYVQEDASFVIDNELVNIQNLESRFNMIMEKTGSFDYSLTRDTDNNDRVLRVFSENKKVNIPAITKGESLGAWGILIDPAFAKANNIKIGDNVKIYSKTFKVSGFVSLPNYIYPLKSESDMLNDPLNFGIAVIRQKDFNIINMGSSTYSVKFLGDESTVESRKEDLKNYLKDHKINIIKWMNSSENPRITFIHSEIDSVNTMSSTLPVAILILTCILTGIVMWRMLKKEAVIIGTMYALGYKRKEILKHYMAFPLLIAIVGGIIGSIIGEKTVKPMLDFYLAYYNMPYVSTSNNLKYVVISIILPIAFLSVFSYFVVRKALKSSPLDLMKGGKDDGKVGFLEKNIHLEGFSFETKFKIREQLRSIPRSLLLLLGITMATMLLLVGFASKSSIDFLLKDTYGSTYKYQYQYLFNTLQQGKPVKGEPFAISSFYLESDNKIKFAVYGMNPEDKYVNLKDKAGNQLYFDKVIITKPLAEKLKVKPQDTIEVVNVLDSKKYSIKIDSIAESYIGEFIYMPIDKLNNMLKLPQYSYIGIWSDEKLKIPENQLMNTASIDDFKNAFNSMTQVLQLSIGSISFISFMIGIIVIYVVTSMIIEENKKSISLMKVLGYKKKEVYSLILNSSSFIIILGYIIGVPLVTVSLGAMYKSAAKDINIVFPVRIDYSYILVGFICIYLTYEISKAISKRKVNKISMNEVLKSIHE